MSGVHEIPDLQRAKSCDQVEACGTNLYLCVFHSLAYWLHVRYFFHIGYFGKNYHGWQRQPNVLSIQEVLEMAFEKIIKVRTTVFGCGRTDASVHASQYFFHADFTVEWDFDLVTRLNHVLPPDIAIFDMIQVEELQNARFDAVKRTYDYFLHTYKDPFLTDTSAYYPVGPLDVCAMQKAVSLLPLYEDYCAFCKVPKSYLHTRCRIYNANLYIGERQDRLRFQISSDRFLRGMIRAIMGKLLEVGMGRVSVEEFEHHLISKQLPDQLKLAYPQGLFLSKVTYPYLDLPAKSEFSGHANRAEASWVML